MTYNLTSFNQTTNIYDFVTNVNTLTSQYFAIFLLVLIFITVFVLLKRYDGGITFIVASLSTTLLSLMMWSINWINQTITLIPMILLLISIFYKIWSD